MSLHAYENSAYAECGNDRSLEKPKENSRKSITRYVILFSILIAVCLVISISGLTIAVHLSLRNEDTHPTTQATYLQNDTEPTMKHMLAQLEELMIENKELESVNSRLWAAVTQNAEQQQTLKVSLTDLNDTIESHHKVQGW